MGFLNLIHPNKVQVMGFEEIDYLDGLDDRELELTITRMFGSRPLAPVISPNKTIEGLLFGVVGGTLGFWVAGLYQDWLSGTDALLMGACIAVLAPLGDLFESAIKRDLDVKDSGRVFGPHGGLLDRLDAVLFTIVAGYYLSLAIVY